jgi:hypothetical protein
MMKAVLVRVRIKVPQGMERQGKARPAMAWPLGDERDDMDSAAAAAAAASAT